jgi:hypothetical protein
MQDVSLSFEGCTLYFTTPVNLPSPLLLRAWHTPWSSEYSRAADAQPLCLNPSSVHGNEYPPHAVNHAQLDVRAFFAFYFTQV